VETRAAKLAYEDVAEQLRALIVAGTFPIGSRLPPEAELCERFSVSRSTVREALRTLASQRIVTTSRGVYGGTTVARFGHTDASQLLTDAIGLLSGSDEITVSELIQARELCEIPAARLAAEKRAPEHVAILRSLILEVTDELSLDEIFRVNSSFHKVVLDATGNRLLRTMTQPLFDTLQTRFARELAARDFWRQVMVEHKDIADAIESRNGEEAGRRMALHLARLRGTYEQMSRAGARTARR
jgi:GntR family transcriptional repressor for pyruvate dehydrogenase complex